MPPAKPLPADSPCPCDSLKSLGDCCLPCIQGKIPATTAETLMRSRYTAHVILAIDYLWDTWSPSERIRSSKQDIQAWASSCEWLGLRILATEAGQASDKRGLVSFIAFFRQGNQLHEHHEVSIFTKAQRVWIYVGHHDE